MRRQVWPAQRSALRVSVLGPLQVETSDGEVRLGAAKERSLVGALALNPGAVVSTDVLIAALWGDRPPASARKTLQTYVSNLRRALGPDLIRTEPSGYALAVEPNDVDAQRFRALTRHGMASLRAGAHQDAARALSEALTLWRGEPFFSVAPDTGLAAEGVRLEEEHLAAVECHVTAELACGRHRQVLGQLEALCRQHPYCEQLWAHLAVALYRCGRQVDALDACRRASSTLRDELGLEPGAELVRVEQAILAHDPDLECTASTEGADAKGATADRTAPRFDDGPGSSPTGARRHGPPDLVRPPVRYALASDGAHIAYQTVGSGPVDLVVVPGFVSHLDMMWEAGGVRFLERLIPHCRVILFDKRGMGLSDRPPTVDVEEWTDDVRTVLDAVGSPRAVVFGLSAGAQTSCLFAATHPDRTLALVLFGGCARTLRADDWEHGVEPELVETFADYLEAGWGTGVGIEVFAPSTVDTGGREYWARYQRISASPGAAVSFMRAVGDIDVRHALPVIQARTLVIHPSGDRTIPLVAARATADAIPGARFVEVDSQDHLIWISPVLDEIIDHIETFVASQPSKPEAERTLATVLASRPKGTASGAAVDETVVTRHGGRPMKAVGRATFPGPQAALRCADALISERTADAIGIHSGECVDSGGDLRGPAVEVAARLADAARTGDVVVSQTVRDLLLGSMVQLEPSGSIQVEGLPSGLQAFRVVS